MTTIPAEYLDRASASWDHMGAQNATFAIMTTPGHEEGWELDEFWRTGEADVRHHLRVLQDARDRAQLPQLALHGATALDFGCGIGRLSRALAARGLRVVGLDFAPSMVERAADLHPGASATFRVNPGPGLDQPDASVDLLLTLISLQHNDTELQHGYLREFLRVLRPGGCAIIGAMAAPLRMPKPHEAPSYEEGGSWRMEMNGMDAEAAIRTLRGAGGRILDLRYDLDQSEWSDLWVGLTYYVQKRETST